MQVTSMLNLNKMSDKSVGLKQDNSDVPAEHSLVRVLQHARAPCPTYQDKLKFNFAKGQQL